jgi:hypothetical protein
VKSAVDDRPHAGVAAHQDERIGGELVRRDRLQPRHRVASGIDDAQSVPRFKQCLDAGRLHGPAHDPEIDLVRLDQMQDLSRDHVAQIERDVRPRLAERRNGVGQNARGDGGEHSQSDDAGLLLGDVAGAVQRGLEIRDRALERRQQIATDAGQLDRPLVAIEQRQAKLRFEIADLHGQHGLGDIESCSLAS